MLTKRDHETRRIYTSAHDMTEPRTAEILGISRYEVRASLDRCRRAGLDVSKPTKPTDHKPPRTDTVEVTVRNPSNNTLNDAISQRRISLPKLVFQSCAIEDRTIRKYAPPPPQITEEEQQRLARVALIRKIHQDGLRRGLFRSRSG